MRSNVFVAMLHFRVFIICINCIVCIATLNNTKQVNNSDCGINNSCPVIPVDNLPRILCIDVAYDFLDCEQPLDLKGNKTAKEQLGYGCTKFGGQKYEDVEFTAVNCTVLNGIECNGNRTFMKEGFPCIKYSGHYFVTTLLYSILLGFLGMDRFCLGHTGTAVGKLLTLGGVGIWWIVDIVLLVTGHLMPEDGSNWMPYA